MQTARSLRNNIIINDFFADAERLGWKGFRYARLPRRQAEKMLAKEIRTKAAPTLLAFIVDELGNFLTVNEKGMRLMLYREEMKQMGFPV